MSEQYYTYSNESFSGCDMVATILMPVPNTNKKVAYVIGELQTISYSIHMDRKPVRAIGNINAKDYVMGPRTIAGSLVFAVFNKHFANKIMKDLGNIVNPGYAFLIDELPPFDVVISAANEYGLRSKLVIYGVRLVNEGQVMSINDVYTENTYQYVATDLEYLNDENQYTSSNASNKGKYKIVETNIKSYNNGLKYTYKKSHPYKINTNVVLNYKIKQHASTIQDGIVDLWITPLMSGGNIIITGKSFNKIIPVKDNLIALNSRLKVQLKEGEYNAIWKDDSLGLKSNEINFKIIKNVIADNKKLYAPTVEYVRDKSVCVYSNVKEHTNVSIKSIDNNDSKTYNATKLDSRRTIITGLEPNKKYSICTYAYKDNNKSDSVIIKTSDENYTLYNKLVKYLSYNKKTLKYCKDAEDKLSREKAFEIYIKIIQEASEEYKKTKKNKDSVIIPFYNSITDPFVEIKNKYEEGLKSLKTEDFKNPEDYNNKKDEYKKNIDICTELIYISSTINNDAVYGYNRDIIIVNPPEPTTNNNCTNSFYIDYSVKSMDFYRIYSNTEQYKKTINKNNFKDTGENYVCTFIGTPNAKHYTYAINEYNYRSPKVEFFTLDDETMADLIENNREETNNINYNIDKIIKDNEYDFDNSLSDDDKNRIAVEMLTSNNIKNISTPIIDNIDADKIELSLNEPEDFLNKYIVVIDPISTALYNNAKYKTKAENNIVFNSSDYAIKPNSIYTVWVENEDEERVSDSITFVTTNDFNEQNTEKEYNINKFFTSKIVDDLKNEFKNNNIDNKKLINIIDDSYNNISATKYNILDIILNNILNNISVLDNMSEILYHFFIVYINNKYDIRENFIENIVLNNNIITINDDNIIAYRMDINSNGIKSSIENNIKSIKFNKEYIYSLVYFSNKELNKRSGFILLNNFGEKYSTYKINIKEVN